MELYSTFMNLTKNYQNFTAFQWDEGQMTFKQLADGINITGNHLKQNYADDRQNISLLAPNTPNFVFGLMGLLGAGHVAIPLNPLLNPEELAALIEHADSKVLMYDPLLKLNAEQAASMVNREVTLLSIPDCLSAEKPDPTQLTPDVNPNDTSMILYTSGTTGDPKGVMLSHKNIYVNSQLFPSVVNFGPEDTVPLILPLFHTFAMTVIVFGALMNGSRILLYPQFVPQKICECVMNEENVILIAVPPMYYMMTRFAPDGIAEKHNIRIAVSGGGPLPVDVSKAFKAKFDFEILEGYGLTETSPVVSLNPPGKNVVGTIGPPFPGVEVQVRDDQGNILKTNDVGELCVKGDIVMQGYYKNPNATNDAFFEEGWLRTGDLALINDEGYIKIVGRAKDLIVCGGENIYPREIEEVLIRYPGVLEVAVVGQPNRLRSEVPYAFVVLNDDAKGKVSESELRKHCREHLGEYKIPEAFSFIDEMPKTATKKIQKEKLKELYFS